MKLPWSKPHEHTHERTGTAMFRIAAPLQPMHRGEHFEDPLHDLLESQHLGGVAGGGTQMTADGGIEYCEIEVDLFTDPPTDAATHAANILTELGAPAGSSWKLDGQDERHPFGASRGIAIKLDGITLPDEVYATSDVNDLIKKLGKALGKAGTLLSWRQGPETTDLYFYGPDADAMVTAATPVLAAHPLAQNHIIEPLN